MAAERELMQQALDALTELRFVLDCATGMHLVRPADANGPAVQADAAISALRAALGVQACPSMDECAHGSPLHCMKNGCRAAGVGGNDA